MQFDSTPESGGSADFLKLKDKESVTGVFRGDVYEFCGSWKDAKFVLGEGKSFRFRINFLTKDNDVLVAKIWEQGVTVYNQLKDLHAEYGLPETIVKITRTGTGASDTSYSILPIKKSEVSEAMEKQLAAVVLKELGHEEKDKDKPKVSSGPTFDTDEEIPF